LVATTDGVHGRPRVVSVEIVSIEGRRAVEASRRRPPSASTTRLSRSRWTKTWPVGPVWRRRGSRLRSRTSGRG